MDYSSDGSAASLNDVKSALVSTFKYGNAICGANPGSGSWANLTNMLNPNLDARLPVLLAISGDPGGHAIVCDGYGYSVWTLYHHLNLGWGGYDNAWYALPVVDTADGGTFTSVDVCVYNVYMAGSGEIISGRVVDGTGAPVAQATVTAVRSGGGTYTATTDSNGIYALAKVPALSQFTLTATAPDRDPVQGTYSTGRSADNGQTSGNICGANFKLATAQVLVEVSSYALLAESYTPTNGGVDPGETVTMAFALQNAGTTNSCGYRRYAIGNKRDRGSERPAVLRDTGGGGRGCDPVIHVYCRRFMRRDDSGDFSTAEWHGCSGDNLGHHTSRGSSGVLSAGFRRRDCSGFAGRLDDDEKRSRLALGDEQIGGVHAAQLGVFARASQGRGQRADLALDYVAGGRDAVKLSNQIQYGERVGLDGL